MSWENTLKQPDTNAELDKVLNEMQKSIDSYKQWEGMYESIKPSVLVDNAFKYQRRAWELQLGLKGKDIMTWEDYLKAISDEDISDWEVALKAFTKKGKELGIPLSVMDLLKKAMEEQK